MCDVADQLQRAASEPPSNCGHGAGLRPGANPARRGAAVPATEQLETSHHQFEGDQPPASDVTGTPITAAQLLVFKCVKRRRKTTSKDVGRDLTPGVNIVGLSIYVSITVDVVLMCQQLVSLLYNQVFQSFHGLCLMSRSYFQSSHSSIIMTHDFIVIFHVSQTRQTELTCFSSGNDSESKKATDRLLYILFYCIS